MHCTLAICTRNRAAQLEVALRSISEMRVPDDLAWDVLVVDNGSSDGTAGVVVSFSDRLRISCVLEPRAGLSNARNTAVANAVGDYIVWTDDDVIVDVDWLAAYVAAFRSHPDASVFGGRVTPVLSAPTPAWFQSAVHDLAFMLAARDFGPAERALSIADDCIPYGANYAMRMVDQRRHPYDPALGVSPGRHSGGEETGIIKAMLREGLLGYWVPSARVQHIIPPTRQTHAHIARFYEGMGEAWAGSLTDQPRTLPVPPLTLAKVFLAFLRVKGAMIVRSQARIRYQTSLSFHYGAMKFFMRQH